VVAVATAAADAIEIVGVIASLVGRK